MLPDPIQVVAQVARALEEIGIPYLVGGSLASSRYGLPRTTQDVDLVVDLREDQVVRLVNVLQDEFYIDAGMIREAIAQRSCFNVIHLQAAYKVDLFLIKADTWAQMEMARRRTERTGPDDSSVTLNFCSPEDIILHKLDWYRLGGGVSDRQWSDVLGVLKVQASALEGAYLRHWTSELGLTELLDRAMREAGVTL
jgi:hypothetical protein